MGNTSTKSEMNTVHQKNIKKVLCLVAIHSTMVAQAFDDREITREQCCGVESKHRSNPVVNRNRQLRPMYKEDYRNVDVDRSTALEVNTCSVVGMQTNEIKQCRSEGTDTTLSREAMLATPFPSSPFKGTKVG